MESLKPGQVRLLAALLECTSLREAAEAAGVSYRTAQRYVKDPVFERAWREQQARMLAELSQLVGSSVVTAVEALRQAFGAEDASWPARVAAARAILGIAVRLMERMGGSERDLAAEQAEFWDKVRKELENAD